MTIGLQRGTVKLLPFDKSWQVEFDNEKRQLVEVFGDKIIAIEHVGSTAIPDAWAKPIIDINVAIRSLDDAPNFIAGLEKLGYTYMPNRWFTDRCFFPKGPERCRTHHLNLIEISNKTAWTHPLVFRDYLITHPSELAAYVALKQDLAGRYQNEREKYTEAKSDFIQSVLRRAN